MEMIFGERNLTCPICGTEQIERNCEGGDHNAVHVHKDRDDYDSPVGTRGGYVEIALCCASGHPFDLVIGNHKGAEVIAWVVPGD
jgi:hypothetical protein